MKQNLLFIITVILGFTYLAITEGILFYFLDGLDMRDRIGYGIPIGIVIFLLCACLSGLTYHWLEKKFIKE